MQVQMHKKMPMREAAVLLAVLAFGLLGLQALERYWPQAGWIVFFALTLTLGFAHGVLDAVLLSYALPKPRFAQHVSLYGAAVLMVLAAAWVWPAAALVLLLLISVWHFGQELHPLRLARIALGGAAVMWPVIVQPLVMQALLDQAFPQAPWLMLLWQVLAWAWAALLMVELMRSWPMQAVRNRLLLEAAALALLYGLLSPWLAFALYFSLFHSWQHIQRVLRASAAAGVQLHKQSSLPWIALLTICLIALVFWQVAPMWQSANWGAFLQSSWALPAWVALVTAVTVPHGVLVEKTWGWLQRSQEVDQV